MAATMTVFKKELWSFFVSPIAYCVVTGFLLISGYLFFAYLGSYNMAIVKLLESNGLSNAPVTLNEWVIGRYFHTLVFVLIFVIPLLTMRLFAEERRRGTFEMLLTSPISVTQIVVGKYLAVTSITLLMLFLAGVFPALLCFKMDPEVAPLAVGFLGVLFCGVSFVALSMAAACFSENQIIAGILGSTVLLLLYVIFSPAPSLGATAELILKYISPGWQVDAFIKGILSIKGCVYFITLTLFGLIITKRILDTERWR
ncbi:MAG: ABC transporter permease [Bdellovibrionota bacterium]|jgi:ABC-2 type transport system permease protein